MDKRSLAEWGWIIVIVLILAFIIAFATPFGTFIVTSVKGLLFSFNQAGSNTGGLNTPQNLNVYNEVFSFDPVDEATGYEVTVAGGAPFTITDSSVDISDKLIGLGGYIDITVKAFNDTFTSKVAKYIYLVPGLYETGSNYTLLLKPWKELVADGTVHVNDGVVVSNFSDETYENSSSDVLVGDLALPSGGEVTTIGEYAFVCCYNLTGVALTDGIKEVGYFAFGYDTDITSITIADSVTFFDESAFYYTQVQSIHYEGSLAQWCEIQFVDFESTPYTYEELYCNGKLITDVVLSKNTTSIGLAFAGCCSLKSVVVPNSVTSINDYAFRDCMNLEFVTLPDNITYIGKDAFAYCYALENINLPDSLTYIGYSAFNCVPFTELIIPENVTTLGDHAFANCENLTTLTIPASVTYIGERIFYDCESLATINYNGTVEQLSKVAFGYEWDKYTSGITIKCADGTITKETALDAPAISITGNTLTITPVDNAEIYGIYVNGEFKQATAALTVDLTALGLEPSEHYINVSARANGHIASYITLNFLASSVNGGCVKYVVE